MWDKPGKQEEQFLISKYTCPLDLRVFGSQEYLGGEN
jgi:hypothetical protein